MRDLPPIWFLRHGQTEWNVEGRIQGRLDSPLTDEGLAQAHTQRDILAPHLTGFVASGGRAFVSPQGRAQHTARIALGGIDLITDPRIAEIDSGDWEGQLKRDVAAPGADLDIYTAAQGGEGYDGLVARVTSFLSDLTGPTIIVSHGMLGQVLRGTVCGLGRDGMARLSNHQGVVYLLENGRETLVGPDAEMGFLRLT
ncbi:histidine phosphatase family protein [Shimia biformata]|uniref:histidine phosphatase family protein n=1 Tax=Shimia biformata TaxID=1294299 RepID=UPI001951B71B|nr:histidine phosphatase family protein [Shimia biformata]